MSDDRIPYVVATEFEPNKVILCADGNFLATSGIHRLPCGAWGATDAEARAAWRVAYRRLRDLVREAGK